MKGMDLVGTAFSATRKLAAWREDRKKPQFMEGSGFYGILHAVLIPAESAPATQKAGGHSVTTPARPAVLTPTAADRSIRCEPLPCAPAVPEPSENNAALNTAERALGQLAAALLSCPFNPDAGPETTPVRQPARIVLEGWLRAVGASLDGVQRIGGSDSQLSLLFDSPGLGQVGVQVHFRRNIVEIGFKCGEQAAERIRRSVSVLTGRLGVLGWRVGRVQLLGARELVIRFVPVTDARSNRGSSLPGSPKAATETERRRSK